jgi:hypothetical protein
MTEGVDIIQTGQRLVIYKDVVTLDLALERGAARSRVYDIENPIIQDVVMYVLELVLGLRILAVTVRWFGGPPPFSSRWVPAWSVYSTCNDSGVYCLRMF